MSMIQAKNIKIGQKFRYVDAELGPIVVKRVNIRNINIQYIAAYYKGNVFLIHPDNHFDLVYGNKK